MKSLPNPIPVPTVHTEPIPVEISNRWARFRCSSEVKKELKDYFRYRKPGVEYSNLFRMGAWDGYTHLFKNGRVATGLFLDRKAELEALGYRFTLIDRRTNAPSVPLAVTLAFGKDTTIRPYQVLAVEAMQQHSNSGGILLCATGVGKTFVAATYFKQLQGKACFVVDELTLLQQSQRELAKVSGEPIAVIGGGAEFRPLRLTVATVQTLARHRHRPEFQRWLDSLDVIIIDELHLALNKRNLDVIAVAEPKAVFGLTATLEMQYPHVRYPATALCGPVIFRYGIEQGVAEGYLSTGSIIQLRFRLPKSGPAPGYGYQSKSGEYVSIESGSPEAEYRHHIILNGERNACIVALAKEGIRRKHSVIVLCERLQHLRLLERRIAKLAIPFRVLSGAVPKEDRAEAIRTMNSGELPLILSSRIFTKGVDISKLDVVIDATGMPNRNAVIQRYGRGVRLEKNKRGLVYIDIADAGNRFSGASWARLKALREIGVPVTMKWEGNARQVFDTAEEKLKND